MLKARIRNVLGVEHAEFEITGITMIAGRNGAGKSSVCDAIWCAALARPTARSVTTKKGAGAVLREGAEVGSATIDWGTGSQRVVWPDGKAEQHGDPRPIGSALGIGAVRWAELDAKQRAVEFAARCGAEPTQADLAAWLKDNGGDPADAEDLWKRIDVSGWDACHKAAAEAATKLKGRWEGITQTGFGTQKAATWRPPTLLIDEVYTVEMVEEELAAARAQRQSLIVAAAVDQAEVERLRALAATQQDLEAAERKLDAEIRQLDQATEKLGATLRDNPKPDSMEVAHKCPHCGGPLKLGRGANSQLVISATAPTLGPQTLREQMAAHAAAHEAWTIAKRQSDQKGVEAVEIRARIRDAAVAATKIANIPDADPKRDAAAADAQLLVTTLEGRLAAVRQMFQARAIYNDWNRLQPMIQALAPQGVRAKKAGEAVAAFNADLAGLCTAAGFPVVALTTDLTVALDGRDYGLLSESERWRCDAALTLTFARMEKAAFTVLDRMDVLVSDARGGVLRAAAGLAAGGLPVVLACTMRDKEPANLPKLAAAEVGRVWWIEAGTLTGLPY